MKLQQARLETSLPHSRETVWGWYSSPGAFQRLSPPWLDLTALDSRDGIQKGEAKDLRIGAGPLSIRSTFEHTVVEPGQRFVDEQVNGPFAYWRHEHRFEPDGPSRTRLVDDIYYRVPAGWLGERVAGSRVQDELERLLRFRHARTAHDLAVHAAGPERALRIAISGTSGLVGRQLVAFLTSGGHEVLRLVRDKTAGSSDIYWDPETGRIDAAGLEGLDAVIHLAGSNISQGRWTARRRADILQSRVRGTSLLAETLAALTRPPAVFISASAVGIYGDGGDALLTEASEHGEGFLPTVCEAWERAADPARRAGVRVVHPRIGVVITSAGGMLGRVIPLFKLGLGGRLGSGAQWMSWIALDDLLALMLHMIHDDSLEGPLNAVSQAPVTNAEFTSELAHALRRPANVRAPAAGLRLAFGDIADELLLGSQRAVSTRLAETPFAFTFPDIGDAIQFELGRLSANVVLARVRAQSTAPVLGAVA